MVPLSCKVKYRIFEPLEAFRQSCPFVLVTSAGVHTHPIPLPQKTPPRIRSEILRLLGLLGADLADQTPQHFLRHPVLKAYLQEQLQHIAAPTLSDLHVSLANRDRLGWYINHAKSEHFPSGTGWEGMSFSAICPSPIF